jgi:arylsulfatase A-like enzyme
MPTVTELLGIELPVEVQGQSRLPLLSSREGREETGAPIFSFTGFSQFPYHLASVRTPSWKLMAWRLSGMESIDLSAIRFHHVMQFRRETKDFVELFDLRKDPQELNNVADRHPEIVRQYLELLQARIEQSRQLAQAPGEMPEATEEYLQQLRSLGYLQ